MSALASRVEGERRGTGTYAGKVSERASTNSKDRILLAVLAAALYLPGLSQNEWANAYYSAAVQAASRSWTSFWFASANTGDFISIDKPPLSIWIMALSARLFGFNTWSMLIPQAAMGICTVLLVHAISRAFLPPAYALFAGLAMATMPIATLMFRFNNPDALLVLLMTLCAWSTVRSLRNPSVVWALITGASIGLGFMTKELEVMLIAPAVAFCVVGSRRFRLPTKIRYATIVIGAVLTTGLGWFIAVSLTPSDSRPFVGGSRTNSVWELILGYNGLDRLTGLDASHAGSTTESAEPTGFIRFIYPDWAGQVSWLLPLALVATAFVLVLAVKRRARSVPAPITFAVVWWWTSVPVLAYMGGIVHPYYALVIVPPTAILAAWSLRIGLSRAASRWARRTVGAGMLATLLINITIIGLYTKGFEPLVWMIIAVSAVASASLVVARRPPLVISQAVTAFTTMALLAGPIVWSLATASSGHIGSSPAAGPRGVIGVTDSPDHTGFPSGMTPTSVSEVMGVEPDTQLVERIQEQAHPGQGWSVAAVGGQNAALLSLAAGLPVLPVGGFDGSDPAPTLQAFQESVAQGRIGGLVLYALPRGAQDNAESERIVEWVEQTFKGTTYGPLSYYSFTETR